MRTTRPVLSALLALLLIPAPAVAAPAPLRWKACEGDPTAQCTTLRVPIDDPAGPKAALAVARRPATQPARRIGTLIVNPGGPGGSGVDLVVDATTFFGAEIRARFDIVGFDPRGVGRSHPVTCAEPLLSAEPSPLVPSAAAYLGLLDYNRELARDCARRTGPLHDHVDTMSVVRDVERLRRALREEQISFYGASYGTLLGAQYAETYPRRVRAMVLDSVMDHSARTDAFLTDGTLAARDSFEQFVSWCARDKRCVLRGRDVRAMWAALLVRAARGTLRDPFDPGRRIDVPALMDVAFSSFYDPQWYSLAYYIKEASETVTARRSLGVSEVENSFPAVFCADWALPLAGYTSYSRRLATLRTAYPLIPFSPLALSSITRCLGRPSAATNPQRPLRPARVPTLLINAKHDPATPYVWAQRTATQLGAEATLVTYNGWGHVTYGRTPCVNAAVDNYLLTLTRPPQGTICPAVLPDQFGVG